MLPFIPNGSRSLKSYLLSIAIANDMPIPHLLHLYAAFLPFAQRCRPMAPPLPESLVPPHIIILEVEEGRRSRASKHNDKVLPPRFLIERPMAVLLRKFVAVEILPRALSACNEESVVSPQRSRVHESKEPEDEHGEGDSVLINRMRTRAVVLPPPCPDMPCARSEEVYPHERATGNESEEVPVVPSSHAVVEPEAMVVLRLDAVVADAAVVAARRAPDVAGFAEFGRDFEGAVLGGRGPDHYPVGCGRSDC
jgi:hypothetical protein